MFGPFLPGLLCGIAQQDRRPTLRLWC